MSNNDSTPATPEFYGNPFIGWLPVDTADNLIYGLALLKAIRIESCDHDEGMGLFRLADALHGAAHHLRFALEPAATNAANQDDAPEVLSKKVVDILVNDAERIALAEQAQKAGLSVEDYIGNLISDRLKRCLDVAAIG